MSIDSQLRWLKTDDLPQVAKRFAEFCKEDIKQYKDDESFDADVYQDAIKLVLEKLSNKTEGHTQS